MKNLYRSKPYIPKEDHPFILKSWEEILNNGMFIQGKYVSQFEKEFAEYCNTKYAIATNSGATALEVAIRATGIENKKIIVPTQTFVASVSAIIRSNNIPVIVDIDPTTQCLNLEIIKNNLDKDVIGIMLVHMAGLITPDYYNIKKFCEEKNLLLFEDASHAVGASIDGIKAGNLGLAGCFSLFATKIITTGEGGIITTNNYDFSEKCRIIRNHGTVRNQIPKGYEGVDYGVNCTYASSNYRMPEISAVIGISQIKRIDEFVEKRNLLANRYNEKIINPKILTPKIPKNIKMTWWQYIVVLLDDKINRPELCLKLLNSYNIPNGNAYWPACHEQPAFQQYIKGLKYPIANHLLERHISLPMYVEMDIDQVDYISNILNKII
jgi:perosamine synthetase